VDVQRPQPASNRDVCGRWASTTSTIFLKGPDAIIKLKKDVQIIKFNMVTNMAMATKDKLKKVEEQMVTKKDSQKMMILLDKILKNTEKLGQERILTFYRIQEIG